MQLQLLQKTNQDLGGHPVFSLYLPKEVVVPNYPAQWERTCDVATHDWIAHIVRYFMVLSLKYLHKAVM